jgi:K+-transporting ATPase ATPase C chain
MKTQIIIALKMLLLMTILTGIIYPLFITGMAQLVFPAKANGSMVVKNGEIVGSGLIGQKFTSDRYFWPRPSAIDYNPLPSGGTNFGMTSQTLKTKTETEIQSFLQRNYLPENTEIPNEMIFASASGIDPHISAQAARLQIKRIAKARNADEGIIHQLVDRFVEGRQCFFLGQERVNVLLLNLELDILLNQR